MEFPAHLLSLCYGLGAGLFSLAVFFVAGVVVTPRRWQHGMRWPDSLIVGLTSFVVLCWIAVSSRNLPLNDVVLTFSAMIWISASIRPRWLLKELSIRVRSPRTRAWMAEFALFYALAYFLIPPAAGSSVLPLGAGDNLELVTYARYARQLLDFGTTNIELAAFHYLHSPAAQYLLAWQSLAYGRNPLQAAMPALFLLTAVFATTAAETARTAFGLSRSTSIVIACIAICAPLSRWVLGSYGLGEMVAALALLYVLRILVWASMKRTVTGAGVTTFVAGVALLMLALPSLAGLSSQMLSGIAASLSSLPLLSLVGLPVSVLLSEDRSVSRPAAVLVLVIVPVLWACGAYAARRWQLLDRVNPSETDRRLATALATYVGLALVLGNVTVQAVTRTEATRRPSSWGQLGEASQLPFRALTLKVADEADGLSTALALYYLPGRTAEVFGRGVPPQNLSFESVSKEQPMFIEGFGCSGVGHRDTVSVQGVGCLLMAPPGMTLDTSYPFNQTFLFISFDRMTAREGGGRWNTQPTLHLRVTSDPQRTPLDRELFVNLLVNPFLPEGVAPQRLAVTWGSQRNGETPVGQRQWLSLPVRSSDWKGNRVWILPIAIDFLDGRTILFHEIALTESPRGTVVSQD